MIKKDLIKNLMRFNKMAYIPASLFLEVKNSNKDRFTLINKEFKAVVRTLKRGKFINIDESNYLQNKVRIKKDTLFKMVKKYLRKDYSLIADGENLILKGVAGLSINKNIVFQGVLK